MGGKYNWEELINDINRLVKLKASPVGLKVLEKKEELDNFPKIRRYKTDKKYYACQFIGQAARLNFAIGFTVENLAVAQCAGVLGFVPKSVMESAKNLVGVWFENEEATLAHQKTMCTAPNKYEAAVVAPLAKGVIDDPDVCLFYGTPGQIILMINGLQHKSFERVDCSVVGESTCSDAWGRTLSTGKPGATIPCYGERRFGSIPDEEMVLCLKPHHIPMVIEGLEWLYKNGIRYPIIQNGPLNSVIDEFCKQ